MRLLVVEDNASLVANLLDYFEGRGHTLDAAPDGVTGLHLAMNHAYDIVLLDWMLPRLDGLEVLQRLRAHRPTQAVIMLTARDDLPHKIAGFRAGADDYLTKPFALPELEVRLEALLARSGGHGRNQRLEIHGLCLDLRTLEVHREGHVLHLYPACRKLLEVLMQASPGAVARERLEQALWGEMPPDRNLLRSHIYELRRRIDGPFALKLLHTLPRMGYRLGVYDTADPAFFNDADPDNTTHARRSD